MNFPAYILSYFSIDVNTPYGIQKAKTEAQFLSDHIGSDEIDMIEFYKIVNKFQNEGYLVSIPNHEGIQVLISLNYRQNIADYGTYNFIFYGFVSIANHFKNSVMPIVITKQDNSLDIGTGFLLGNNSTLVTAKHVVENAELIQIPNKNGGYANAKLVATSSNPAIDIALILLEETSFANISHFNIANGEILEDIMTIGYPPIPGFDAVQLYETASINNSYKFSKGQIIGQETAYLDGINYLIINAKVKGGNSGSPVINRKGNVVGMIVQIPTDAQDASKLDSLGYGIVTPSVEINKLLGEVKDGGDIVINSVLNTERGFKIS
jgi:serine protease Do